MEIMNYKQKSNTISIIIQLANPVFIVLAISLPTGALIYSLNILNYVHIMTGALWTGIDLFMGLVLGPVLGGMDPKNRAAIFTRLVPKMTFLMPVIAAVTSTTGVYLALRLGYQLTTGWIVAALVVVAILTVQGLGIILPTEIRVFKELLSETPDIDKISRLGMRTARVAGLQGIMQLAIIFIMASIRF